jgi:hypothetical protein
MRFLRRRSFPGRQGFTHGCKLGRCNCGGRLGGDRGANDITVYLRLVERLDSPQSRAALGVRFGAAFEHLAMRSKGYLVSGMVDRFYSRLLRDPRFPRS